MRFVWDTNILIHCLKRSPAYQKLDGIYKFFTRENEVIISIVTVAEIYSLAYQRQWQQEKLNQLNTLIQRIKPVPIARQALVDAYIRLDAYSQGRDPLLALPVGITSRNMGKNDLWIAATAVVAQANLVTFDQDFDHLHDVWLKVYRPDL